MSSDESTPLVNQETAVAAATVGVGMVNATAAKLTKTLTDGPLTFRMLGFLGGLAMIVSNGLAILERFFSFNFAGAAIATYNVLFGILISLLEFPTGVCSQRFSSGIRYYCKFLEFTWGRGVLFVFVGTLQVANWNMLDWAVGGFMIFVGVTTIGVGVAASRDLKLLKFSLKDEQMLKRKWLEHDSDGNGTLDAKELTAFVADADVPMTRNEIAAAFLALDRNFDEKIAYEEMYSWWMGTGAGGGVSSYSV